MYFRVGLFMFVYLHSFRTTFTTAQAFAPARGATFGAQHPYRACTPANPAAGLCGRGLFMALPAPRILWQSLEVWSEADRTQHDERQPHMKEGPEAYCT